MDGLFDIHSHILPSVDDGAKDMEMTRKMAGAAYGQGVRRMIATPHYYPGHGSVSGEKLQAVYREAAAALGAEYEGFELLLGNEIYYKEEVTDLLKAGEVFSLAGTHYILLEFPFQTDYKYIYHAVRRCVDAGYYPVVAHMERYSCLYKEEKKVKDLVSLGAYMQMNAENFKKGLFRTGKSYCLGLIRSGLIHFLASDCHNLDTRCPDLGPAAAYLEQKMEKTALERILFRNPQMLLEDRCI